jgi:hypothetical protein
MPWKGTEGTEEATMITRQRVLYTIVLLVLCSVLPQAEGARLGPTMAGFQAVQLGMSYSEVVAILGPPTRTVSEIVGGALPSAIYAWDIPGRVPWENANIWIVFERDKVAQKSQQGLR